MYGQPNQLRNQKRKPSRQPVRTNSDLITEVEVVVLTTVTLTVGAVAFVVCELRSAEAGTESAITPQRTNEMTMIVDRRDIL